MSGAHDQLCCNICKNGRTGNLVFSIIWNEMLPRVAFSHSTLHTNFKCIIEEPKEWKVTIRFTASDCCQTIYFLLKQMNMESCGALPGLQPPSGHIHLLLTVYPSSLGAWLPGELTEGTRSFQGATCSLGELQQNSCIICLSWPQLGGCLVPLSSSLLLWENSCLVWEEEPWGRGQHRRLRAGGLG